MDRPAGVAQAATVLLADDDASLREALVRMLEEDGYRCLEASDGAEALTLIGAASPDLVVLDVMMPKMDGFEVCERMRRTDAATPVLFLSAKGDIVDKRTGYRMGADDYIAKPFSGEELRLRVSALLRRAKLPLGQSVSQQRDRLAMGGLTVDFRSGDVSVDGKRIGLTPKESRIVRTLAEHPGEVFSKEDLIRAIWGEEYLDGSISISVYVRRIREKLEADPANPRYVQTVWRYGYRLGDAKTTAVLTTA